MFNRVPKRVDHPSTPSFFRSGLPAEVRVMLAILFSIALMVSDRYFGLMEYTREAFSFILYPAQLAATTPVRLVQNANDLVVQQAKLSEENQALRMSQLTLFARLSKQQTLQRELNELRALNQIKPLYDPSVQIAEILHTGRDPFSYKVIINKGTDAGLKAGQPVVDAYGLLGQITRAQLFSTEVTLIIEKDQMVPVMIERTGQRTILYGYGGGVEVRYLTQNADIQVGDRLVTSGLDGLYPQGIPVARITRVTQPSGVAFANIQSEPLAGVEQARYVLVINHMPAPQPKSPVPAPAAALKRAR